MKKMIFTAMMILVAMSAVAQSVNVKEGKKLYDAERYDKALPYLIKAVAEGDADSKARLATMIFTMQVPAYSMDRDGAMLMLDEAIEAGSVLAMERKGFCTLTMGNDTKEDKQKGIDLLALASEAGSADASFSLFKVYRDGIKTYSDGEVCIAPNEEMSLNYLRTSVEQHSVEGMAYLGWFTLEGLHGMEKDAAAGSEMILGAWNIDNRMFAGNCLEPGIALVKYLKSTDNASTATPIEALLKKYHPTQYK